MDAILENSGKPYWEKFVSVKKEILDKIDMYTESPCDKGNEFINNIYCVTIIIENMLTVYKNNKSLRDTLHEKMTEDWQKETFNLYNSLITDFDPLRTEQKNIVKGQLYDCTVDSLALLLVDTPTFLEPDNANWILSLGDTFFYYYLQQYDLYFEIKELKNSIVYFKSVIKTC